MHVATMYLHVCICVYVYVCVVYELAEYNYVVENEHYSTVCGLIQ